MNFETLENRCMMATDFDPVVERMVDIRDNYGEQVEVGTNGDFDRNGIVNFKDFLLVAADLRTFYSPVEWTIPPQRSDIVNRIVKNGIAELSISITNKNGTFVSTCDVLLGDLKTGNKCKILVDSTNLLATDDPWTLSVAFKRQNISPTVSIATVTVERLMNPIRLIAVQSTRVQLGVIDFRHLSIRRTRSFPPSQFPELEEPYRNE